MCWHNPISCQPWLTVSQLNLNLVIYGFHDLWLNIRFLRNCTYQDQKKFHEQQNTEQEAIFGSRPSPGRPISAKKGAAPRANGNPTRRLSMNASQNGGRSTSKDGRRDSGNNRPIAPVNYVAISKEDSTSHVSGTDDTVSASP